MYFERLVALRPHEPQSVAFHVDDSGWCDPEMAWKFFHDNPGDAALVWYDPPVEFRDTDESAGRDIVRLAFDVQSKVLFATAVPYTQRQSEVFAENTHEAEDAPVRPAIGPVEQIVSEATAPKIGSSEKWQELATQFEKLSDYTRANWQCNRQNNVTTFHQWRFAGGNEAKHCETLCRYAGTLLLKSPNVSLSLSANAHEQSDPAWRWLYFLKENYNASRGDGHHPPIGDDGTIYLLEKIPEVASVSVRVCRECAALEL